MTNTGQAKLGHSGTSLPKGRLLSGSGTWMSSGIGCFPKPGGAISCAAGNGHGFYMGKDDNAGANPY